MKSPLLTTIQSTPVIMLGISNAAKRGDGMGYVREKGG